MKLYCPTCNQMEELPRGQKVASSICPKCKGPRIILTPEGSNTKQISRKRKWFFCETDPMAYFGLAIYLLIFFFLLSLNSGNRSHSQLFSTALPLPIGALVSMVVYQLTGKSKRFSLLANTILVLTILATCLLGLVILLATYYSA